jgi:prostaglandin-H2 D-isomerase / glutathione transferase
VIPGADFSFYFLEIGVVSYEKDEKIQAEKRKLLNSETLPFYLSKLDEIAKNNNGHLALNRLTWADLYFAGLLDYMNFMAKQDLTAKYANLKKVTDNVTSVDGIKKWVAKRPQSDA